ncbi:MAG: hypothetical protein LQ337_002736 [Flavoplaca oasis]|nr:MAG: hypothetical protein LQ337_002736 [Flavoplaca oasis]
MADPSRPGNQYQQIRIDQGGRAQLGNTYTYTNILRSILITTRSPRITFAKLIRLKKFGDLNYSLAVLIRRSNRQVYEDIEAKKLAERFDGLLLALATAGDYIS